jgi:hypothetical protein
MGQQQLLLIILGIIIVATAIAVGLQQFMIGSETANREAIVNDIANIVGNAQSYYSRPNQMGGGSGSFSGYSLPIRLNKTGNASYDAEGNGSQLIVEGTSMIHNRVIVMLTLTRSDDGWDYNWFWEHEGL